jgi:hypothetical protein
MLVKPAADFAELIHHEMLDWSMHFTLNPLNHPREKMMDEVGMWFRLLNRKASRPRQIRRSERKGHKPEPTSGCGPSPQIVDEFSHSIRITKPACAASTVFSPPKCTARNARTDGAAHPCAHTNAWLDTLIGIPNSERARFSLDFRLSCFHRFPLVV